MKVDNRIVFGVIAGAAVGLFFWGKSCERKEWIAKGTRIDTTYLPRDSIIHDTVPKPYAVLVKGKDGKIIVDTHFVEKPFSTDTLGIVEDYNRIYAYSYTERITFGSVQIDDTISQNMFLGRGVVIVSDSIPVVTKTVLLVPPKKIVLYATLSAMGNKNDILYGAGGGLSLKGLNDRIYGVELKYLKGGSLYYEGKIMFPIRLKKR